MNYSSDKTIGIASDHAGYVLKEIIVAYLTSMGYEVINFGTNSDSSCDYPDYAHPLASEIDNGKLLRGITICGSGNGISMVVNKYPKVRAALCWNEEIVKLCRQHNNANILTLPARFISETDAIHFVDLFFSTEFEGGRHQTRVEKINK